MKKYHHLYGLAGLIWTTFALVCWFVIAEDSFYLLPIHILLAIISFALFFLSGGIASITASASKGRTSRGLKNILYTGLVAAVVIVANLIVTKHDMLHLDATEEGVYTLAPQTEALLSSLNAPVTARLFAIGGNADPDIALLLKRLAHASKQFQWSVLNPETNPLEVERFGITESDTLHLSFENENQTRVAKIVKDISEQTIANALLRLIRSAPRPAYYLTGHDEPALDSLAQNGYRFFAEALEGENVLLKEVQLSATAPVPDDAQLLIIAAPNKELFDAEIAAIHSYIERGGHLLILHEHDTAAATKEIAASIGIAIGKNLVVDSYHQMFGGQGYGLEPVVNSYGEHAITKKFSERTIFSTIASVSRAVPENMEITILARTGIESWAEHNLELLLGDSGAAAKETDDISGPVPIAAAWERGEARAVVIGDGDFAANVHIRKAFNRDFLLNAVNWLLGEKEGITIRPRALRKSIEPLTSDQLNKMFIVTTLAVPEFVLLAGVFFWWRRKYASRDLHFDSH